MLWLKALHVIFVVFWFAGLLYLPRLFVYHAQSDDRTGVERFRVMERKLFVIMTIGGAGTVVLGLWMLVAGAWRAYAASGWLHVKLVLVIALIAFHLYCGKLMREFRHDGTRRSHVFYRWINEIPALLLVAIVILVVVKPF